MTAHVVSDRWPARIACGFAIISIAALSSCNLPKPSVEATSTPGAYASAGQSLSESGNQPGVNSGKVDLTTGKCPLPGMIDNYNLCFQHQFNFVMSDGKGYTLTPYGGSNCVLLSVSNTKVVVGAKDGVHDSVGFKIDGNWDFAGATCTLTGQTSLKVSVYGSGDPPCRNSDQLFLLVYESWEKAPIHAECKPKGASEGFHSTPVDVTVPVMEDRGVDLKFYPVTTVIRQEATVGPFSGIFMYEVMPAPGVPASESEDAP